MTNPTPLQLKAAIDRGQTGDKIAYPDPAAAPLGTDEEAAGTRVSPEAAALAHADEVKLAAGNRPDTKRKIWPLVLFIGGLPQSGLP